MRIVPVTVEYVSDYYTIHDNLRNSLVYFLQMHEIYKNEETMGYYLSV